MEDTLMATTGEMWWGRINQGFGIDTYIGLVRSLQPPDILWIHWRVYNSIANTSKRVLFCPLLMPMSEAFSISFTL